VILIKSICAMSCNAFGPRYRWRQNGFNSNRVQAVLLGFKTSSLSVCFTANSRSIDREISNDKQKMEFFVQHQLALGEKDCMENRKITRVKVIDSHTGGEPARVVVSGGPDLGSGPLAQRLEQFKV